jgi:hypothetical protein
LLIRQNRPAGFDRNQKPSDMVVDARFIAIIETTLESPLGQGAMIPLLAWVARNAPADLKAAFFAVMASFTNMALTASSLHVSGAEVAASDPRLRSIAKAFVPKWRSKHPLQRMPDRGC